MTRVLKISRFVLAAAAGMACLFISDNSSSIRQSSLVTQADARVGNPLTPVSVVAHRQTRRAVRRGAVVTGAAIGTGAYYRGYYGTGTGYYGTDTGYYGTNPSYSTSYYGSGYYGTNPYGTGYYGSGYYGTNPYGTSYYGTGYYRGVFGPRWY